MKEPSLKQRQNWNNIEDKIMLSRVKEAKEVRNINLALRFICTYCQGSGYIRYRKYFASRKYSFVYRKCEDCVGGVV